MAETKNPIPVGTLVRDKNTKRLAVILDHISNGKWDRLDIDNGNGTGIIYGMQFVDGVGPQKTYRYAYEIKVLSENEKK